MDQQEIIKVVANEFKISVDDITSKRRSQPLPTARQIAGFIICTNSTVIKAGEQLNMTHGGIVKNNQVTVDRLDFDNDFRAHFNNILKQLNLPYETDMKISYEQLKELKSLIEYFIEEYKPSNEMEQLLKNTMVAIYEKVRKRVIYHRSNFSMSTNEQLVFRYWQQHIHLMPRIKEFGYAENVCRIIVNQIHISYG